MKSDQDRSRERFPAYSDADLRAKAAAIAAGAWLMSGFELSADPGETPTNPAETKLPAADSPTTKPAQ